MKRLFLRGFAGVVVAVLLFVCLPVSLPVEAAFSVPFEVVTETGEYLKVVADNNTYSLYLPGYVNRKAVSVWYSGYGKLRCPAGDISNNGTGRFDLSGDTYTFEETTVDGSRTYRVRIMGGSGSVPSLYITLDDAVTISWLNADKNNKGTGRMRMLSGKGQEIYAGKLDSIKGRGNTSFTHPGLAADKKSYNIKLEKKTELIAGAGKAKKWALIHMRVCDTFHYDWTGLANLLGYQTYSALVGDGYADVKAQFVDVYIEGEYRGAYLLAERVDINAAVDITDTEEYVSSSSSDHTVVFDFSDPAIKAGIRNYQYTSDAVKKQDFDITGGYLLEINTPYLEESGGFETKRGMLVDIKVPEACTREQVSYIARYFQLFENALYSDTGYNEEGKHYSDYVDMDSLASLLMTCSFFKNWELFRTSTYMYLDTADSDHPKLTFGPAWDFETGAYMYETDHTFYSKHQLYVDTATKCYDILGQLSSKGDVRQRMAEKQQELKKILNATLGTGKYEGISNANTLWRTAVDSLEMNWARWGYEDTLKSKGGAYAGHANTYSYYAQEYVEALKKRRDTWNALWDEQKYLLGVTVVKTPDDGKCTLTAKISGKATSLSWYRLQADNTLQLIPGEEGKTFVVKEEGTYYCLAFGDSNVRYEGALNEILASSVICLTSAPMVLRQTDFVKPAPTTTTTTKKQPAGGNEKTTSITGHPTADGQSPSNDGAGVPGNGQTTKATFVGGSAGASIAIDNTIYAQAVVLVLNGLVSVLPAALLLAVVQVFLSLNRQNGFAVLFTAGIPALLALLLRLFGLR